MSDTTSAERRTIDLRDLDTTSESTMYVLRDDEVLLVSAALAASRGTCTCCGCDD
jgi:hypothetical protein